ncbi:HpcH/HpaI aldolase/citrate lyase family protein [Candidatus Entotheonella palauensis]|uniref:HpcH/HpaI aldolase/citrate lyase family protein n=1 Tax=Candidatus Entotheonella palauensis TaxID=93172 RepID=UPI0015C471B2|nr:CoA ester lyase [Candidatus Entotheonella palauensis]
MKPLRSMLFVPGNKPAWVEKAIHAGADGLILDLEDSVPFSDKAAARPMAAEALARFHALGPVLTVRINALETGMAGDDIDALVSPGLSAILAPKIETPQDIATLDALLTQSEHRAGLEPGQVEIYPTLETAKGIYHAYQIATCSPRVPTLACAAGPGGDTARSLGYVWTKEGTETLYIRSKVLLDARAAGVPYPLITSWFDVRDLEGLKTDVRLNRQLGYSGQIVIHPSHVPIVNEAFTPTPQEIAYHQGLLAAMEEAERQGTSAVTYEGAMVDIAMVKTSRQLLELARAIGALDAPMHAMRPERNEG